MTDRPSVLVPVRVLEGESVPEGVPALLANAHVVLLGYHVVPEQTAPGQARMQFEDRATRKLDEFEALFVEAGATVDRTLVFTHEGQTTIDRMIYEHDCLAVLVPNATAPPEDVLVAVRGTVGIDRLARLVAGLFADSTVAVTLYHVATDEETDEDAETLLDGLADRLADLGLDPSSVSTRVERDRGPKEAIAAVADEYDAVVMGESDPSLETFVFGMPAERVAETFLGPVLVVQRERPEEETPS
jgi:nucleotide-binding universal stress UspA family protein